MNIAYYMPLKPPDHANPSGDLVTGTELRRFLERHGHRLDLASTLRSRWIFLRPRGFLRARRERGRIVADLGRAGSDLWLTYHSYYKAPDILGPACSRRLKIPYVIFQGIYSTKRRRSLKTLPGFLLNRAALNSAALVFTNKQKDHANLRRLLPAERIRYIPPGLQPTQFEFDGGSRRALREQWRANERPVVLTAAMLRPGVKTAGVRRVIESCAALRASGTDLLLVVAGDGRRRGELERLGRERLGEHCRFVGRIPRLELSRYYSAADLFVFPGLEESLGLVYLEAQAAGLPVVACRDWGASEAVVHERTGLLTPAAEPTSFVTAIAALIDDPERRRQMGRAAAQHVRDNHDAAVNYRRLSAELENVLTRHRRVQA